jgi:hypothetical protein
MIFLITNANLLIKIGTLDFDFLSAKNSYTQIF